MKETYLSHDFRETAAQRFPAQAKKLNAAFDARLNALLAENPKLIWERSMTLGHGDDRCDFCMKVRS